MIWSLSAECLLLVTIDAAHESFHSNFIFVLKRVGDVECLMVPLRWLNLLRVANGADSALGCHLRVHLDEEVFVGPYSGCLHWILVTCPVRALLADLGTGKKLVVFVSSRLVSSLRQFGFGFVGLTISHALETCRGLAL
jgi:hypothetical protein